MTANETAVQNAHQVTEDKDIQGWVNCFINDGTFTEESIRVTHRGPYELGRPVEIHAPAFSYLHRELFHVYAVGDMVSSNSPCREPTTDRWRCLWESCRRQVNAWAHRAATCFV